MRAVLTLVATAVAATACGGDVGGGGGTGSDTTIVVTTSVLGDVVDQVVTDDAVDIEIVMPRGADPHEFAASARQAEAIAEADLVVANGAGFEHGLEATLESAGRTFAFADHVELLDGDAHFWTDPTRMATAVESLGEELDDLGIDHDAAAYIDQLEILDAEIEALLAPVPAADRVLVTNHEVLGSFADRYGFVVVGTVIPAATTGAAPSAGDVEDLAEVIEEHSVPAIFGETTSSASVAEALAESVGDVEIVTLHTESLGEDGSGADTYIEMQRTNAALIVEALT